MPPRRPKAIGTAAETAVVRFLREHGFAHAERRSLRGQLDAGDITGTPGVCWEVKGGVAAKAASDRLIQQWLDETEKERVNAGCTFAVLVIQRAGYGPERAGSWWAIMPGYQYEHLCFSREGHGWLFGDRGPIRMHLAQVCPLLNFAGYGGVA